MITGEQASGLIGAVVHDRSGAKIGKVSQYLLDDASGALEFLAIATGFLGATEVFAPAGGATITGSVEVTLAWDKAKVTHAPQVGLDAGHLDPAAEALLYAYYGLTHETTDTGAGNQGWVTEEAAPRAGE